MFHRIIIIISNMDRIIQNYYGNKPNQKYRPG
jgi:hypothetical protein